MDGPRFPNETSDVPDAGDATDEAPKGPMAGSSPDARQFLPPRYRGPVAIAGTAAVVVALVGGMLVWRPGSGGNDAAVSAAPRPTASAQPADAPIPTVAPGVRLAASPWTPVAELTAEDATTGVVGLASSFRLASLDATPAAEFARRLTVVPEIGFSVSPDVDGRSVRITPDEPLAPGAVYRFTLAADDGRTLESWAFQAHQPLRVIATLPRDTEADVPLDTGIEITFDQDGVVDAASHVTVEPKVDGRFEQHGRVLAFVPEHPLDPATLYTITLTRGVAVGATGEELESDVRFRFETALAGEAAGDVTYQFSDDIFESPTSERPVIALWAFQETDQAVAPPTSAPIEVHRLRDLDAAVDAFRQVRSFPRWTRASTKDLVSTAGLTRVLAFDAELRDSDGILWFSLPERLPPGWYLVTMGALARPIQAMLQVTDIAGYLVVSETKTLVWANDLATGGPVADAVVSADDTDLGRTGADGSLMAKTPASLLQGGDDSCTTACVPVVTVRAGDRAIFLPATGPRDVEGKGSGYDQSMLDRARYWHVFDTDRTLYRRTDTVNVWGVVRDRDTGDVPETVTIRLSAYSEDGNDVPGPPISMITVHPNGYGAIAGSIALDDVPEGDYRLELKAADDLIASTEFAVDRILKPAYRLDVTTGRRVYVQGDRIRVTAHATFYEGTPVPGVALRSDGFVNRSFVTDASGTASLATTAKVSDDDDQVGVTTRSVTVTPARAEEGEIAGASREILVFPSSWTIDATAEVRAGRVRVKGDLHVVDRDRLEREMAAGNDAWNLDPAGAPVAGRTVTATFTEFIPHRTQTGTRYDFIEKKVVPVYDYTSTERDAGTIKVKTDRDGDFSVSIPTSGRGSEYRVRLSATDPDSHAARWTGWPFEDEQRGEARGAILALTDGGDNPEGEFSVGDRVDLTMTDPTAKGGEADRFLFYSAQRGLRDALVQTSGRYRGTFAASAAPGIAITGVRFTGSRYVESPDFNAHLHLADRRLTVALSTDARRYAPGDKVTITATTRDQAGDPVAATVILRAVDEKLFGLGGAEAADPLGELYAGVPFGIRARYRSHRAPHGDNDGGGDTTGGGRDDFRDTVLFKSIDTGRDGRASVTFPLSDDLTSWHVSASAIGAGLTAGEGSVQVPVGLPFFADATIASEYLVSDRPLIGLRAFGTALPADARVTFSVDSESLGLHADGLHADAYETVAVPLPPLSLGTHRVTITARTGSGASARQDRLTRSFTVVASRLARTQTWYGNVTGTTHVEGGVDLTEVVVSDAGAGRYLPLLLDLADVDSPRLERALAASIAASLASDHYSTDPVGHVEFDGNDYQVEDGGLAILPYASSDLEASALAAIIGPERFNASRLEFYLSKISGNEAETRERRIVALAGRAGLGSAVLPEIRAAAADPDLTIRERLMLGLGAAALGDAGTARSIAGALVERYGEAVTDQARLQVGGSAADITAATALIALLAAANGDPLAPRFWAYVESNPGTEAPYALHGVGFVAQMLARGSVKPASFAYKVGDERKVVELDAGGTFRMTVTAKQLAALTIEPVSGEIGVTTSWREAVKTSSLEPDPDVSIRRRVTPSGTIGAADLVTVALTVDLGPVAPSGCHRVTEFVPSGLVPVGNLAGWVDPETGEVPPGTATFPYAQIGQRVYFCAETSPRGHVAQLSYVARVVTSGTYTWEPALVESRTGPGRAALSKESVVTID